MKRKPGVSTSSLLDRRIGGRWARKLKLAPLLFLCALCVVFPVAIHAQTDDPPAQAETEPEVEGALQFIDGSVEKGQYAFYKIADLSKGQTLRILAKRRSGNLDPFVAILDPKDDPADFADRFSTQIDEAVEEGVDLSDVLPRLIDRATLAWDDDSGPGHAAQLQFEVPEDGNYHLLVRSTPVEESFGRFRLIATIDADLPKAEVIESDRIEPFGELEVTLNQEASLSGIAVEEKTLELSAAEKRTFFELGGFGAGDHFYARLEALNPQCNARLELQDYVGKTVGRVELAADEKVGTIDYKFDDNEVNFRLRISTRGLKEGDPPSRFRLLLGVNSPWVLEGEAQPLGRRIIRQPIEVRVGVKVQQITFVDQAAENFGVVATIRLDWTDPELAFSPDEVQRPQMIFAGNRFAEYIEERGLLWPEFTIYNQQGNRWVQNRIVQLDADGRASYAERFSTTLQAPDFDFQLYPFDRQRFFVRVHSVMRDENFIYKELEDFSNLSEALGEEEWVFTGWGTSLDKEAGSLGAVTSRFTFEMEARRQLNYYMYRIFLPVLFIVVLSGLTFFLNDYTKRIELCSANLLLFIAFNFTIAASLPRLGYLTFLDKILIGAFCVTATLVVFNIVQRRLEQAERHTLVRRLEFIFFWGFIIACVVGVVSVVSVSWYAT